MIWVRRMLYALFALVLVFAAVAATFIALGPARIWSLVVGPADLGPVTFETLDRGNRLNDALACPPGLCTAAVDIVPPVFAVPARDLRVAFGRAVASEPRMTLADADDLVPSERWIQRSARMEFPDTIDVRFIELPGGRSTVAIYSRAQIGIRDWGVNRQRIERLLARLAREAPIVGR